MTLPLMCRSEADAEAAGAQLFQHIALKAADKAEFRSLAAATALRLLEVLPEHRQAASLSLACRMTQCPKVGDREESCPLGDCCRLVVCNPPNIAKQPSFPCQAFHVIFFPSQCSIFHEPPAAHQAGKWASALGDLGVLLKY